MTLPEIERRRARLARKRKAWTAVLSSAVLACILACAWSAMRIMPFYGDWYRTNRFDEHPAGFLSGPLLVEVRIEYDGEPPRDARLVESGTGKQIYGLSEDTEESSPGVLVLRGDFDAALRPGDYALKLRPGDNRRLSCDINALPSEKYAGLVVTPYRSRENDLWLMAEASYHHAYNAAGPDLRITLEGADGSEELYAFRADGPEYVKRVNVSALIFDLGLNPGGRVRITASAERRCGGEDPETAYVRAEKDLALENWPPYDPGGDFNYDPSDTDAYLARRPDGNP